MGKFYDGTKLLSLKDLNGERPEIYMCVGNRTAGKTFFFKRLLLRRFMKNKDKFLILVRFSYELEKISENFFLDLERDCKDFTGHTMTENIVGKGAYAELYFDDDNCGYAVALNSADNIKKLSSRFSDVSFMFFDEFQSEVGKYCPKEIDKFQSIHVSVARGGGSSVRYVPVYMCSNNATILNPYYSIFGVHRRIQDNTKFLRGTGWVLEQTFNENAATELKESGFGKAFSETNYIKYSTENLSLLDSKTFIENSNGEQNLCMVFMYRGSYYGIWCAKANGYYYVSNRIDPNWKNILAFSNEDHTPNMTLITKENTLIKMIRNIYNTGGLRFENLSCKSAILEIIGFQK